VLAKHFHGFGNFLKEKKGLISSNSHYHSFPQLFEDDFKITLAFIVDSFQYFNELNLYLEGRENTICDLKNIISSFHNNLDTFLTTVKKNNLSYLPELKRTIASLDWSECTQIVALSLQNLIHEFNEQFTFLKKYDSLYCLVFNPLKFPGN
jgi:hypothetical protein